MDDLARTVAKLQAAEDIRHLKARYARVCDTGYTPERDGPACSRRTPSGTAAASAATRASTRSRLLRRRLQADHLGAALHDRAHDRGDDDLVSASGTWYLWKPCTIARPDGPKAVWLTGGYADRYVKEDGAWRFSEVLLDVQTIAPYDEGWVRTPFLED